jgi:dienelactone hydrolase
VSSSRAQGGRSASLRPSQPGKSKRISAFFAEGAPHAGDRRGRGPLKPDWEAVISAVVDFALTVSEVHPERLVISGWSLGAYLAPRAASGEHRLAACIADPGQWSVIDSFRALPSAMGVAPAANLSNLDDAVLQKLQSAIDAKRDLYGC